VTFTALHRRVSNKWRRLTIEHLGRRPFRLESAVPYVSFTFDDFPSSALAEGGRILAKYGVRGTYFTSLNLLDSMSVSGRIASAADLTELIREGHEIGCHTFEHLDGTRATAADFERSIALNRRALRELGIDCELLTFAYPLEGPMLSIKRTVGRHFAGCRGGGQTFNRGDIDLNLLKAYFLDRRQTGAIDDITKLVEQNAAARGWLIFATHDVAEAASPYGCSPGFFEAVVRAAVDSGSRVLPMARVWEELGVAN
jgi:peptidoglycan/xylan/chitin deacetylase (PgdA/CDA1 family)